MKKTTKLTCSMLLLMIGHGSAHADIGPGMHDGLAILALFPLFLLIIPIASRQGTRWLWFLITLIGYPISTVLLFLYFPPEEYGFHPTVVMKVTAIWMLLTVVLVAFRFIKTKKIWEK